jgi:hypothetical protein
VPTFTPPTVDYPAGSGPLLSRFRSIPVGQSVVKRDGAYELTPFPWAGELEGLTEGEDYFLGGRTYTISDDVAASLDLDGFGYDYIGYGEGAFGGGPFGG